MTSLPAPADHRVHGMGLDAVAPDWPALREEEVAALLRHYPRAGSLRAMDWHSPRPFSAAALVRTDKAGDIFVKRHHALVRDDAGVREEHRFMAHLRAAGVPVADVLTTAEGSSVVVDGDWTYEVHRQATGVDLYRDVPSWSPFSSVHHARAAGAALARLHKAAAGYDAPARQAATLVCSFSLLPAADPLAAVARFVAARPALAAFLENRPWRRDIARLLDLFQGRLAPHAAAFTPLWTHNDWHASNLLWSDAGPAATVATVLDFGMADRTCAVHDLALAIERNAIEWLRIDDPSARPLHLDLVQGLLQGYEAELPLSPRQGAALIALLPLVHLEFALSETDYFNGPLASPENAAVAYDTYLLGHAEWFLRDDGRRLLSFLQDHLTDQGGRAFRWPDDARGEEQP